MRKLLAFGILLFAASFVLDGCRKGPEDPFLSFRSRKKRVEGYWKVVKYLYQNIDSTQLVRTYTKTVDPGDPCGNITETTTRDWIIRYHFDGDGRYEKDSTFNWRYNISFAHPTAEENYNFSVTTPGTPPPNTTTWTGPCVNHDSLWVDTKRITKGRWMFAGATNDIKNKERMFLTDGEDQYGGVSYDIIQLRDKEMKLAFSVTVGIDPVTSTPIVGKIQYNMEATEAWGEGD